MGQIKEALAAVSECNLGKILFNRCHLRRLRNYNNKENCKEPERQEKI